MPTVSVIVPNYNHARFLRQRVDSILAQTYQDYELILLDDASTDESQTILSEYASHLKVTHAEFNQTNSGSPFKQWNKGVRLARGEYVWIAESDDYADARLVERLRRVLDADARLSFAYCRSRCVTPEGRLTCFGDRYLSRWSAEQWASDFCMDGREMCEKYFCRTNPVPNASGVLFRKEVYERAGGADEQMRLCGDWKLWAGMALEGKVGYLCEPLNYFRRHGGSVRSRVELTKEDVSEYLRLERWVLDRVRVPEDVLEEIRRNESGRWVPALMSLHVPRSEKRVIWGEVKELDPQPFRTAVRPALTTVGLKLKRHWSNGHGAQWLGERVPNQPLRITLIDTYDYAGGGGSRCAYRLHDGLGRIGADSKMLVCYKGRNDPEVYGYRPTRTLAARAARRLRQHRWAAELKPYAKTIPFEHTFYLDDRAVYGSDPFGQMPEADVIHLHFVAGFVDLGAFVRWLPKATAVVWTLHDMAPLTGGCCYDLGCGKFVERCGACPQLGSREEMDPTRKSWERKERNYAMLDAARVHIVTPSRWLGEQVRRSRLVSRFRHSVIPYGIDLDVFQPRDKKAARQRLGIPGDARVALFNAFNIREYRKGYHLMREMLASIEPARNGFLLSVGREGGSEDGPFPHLHLGRIEDDELLSFVYSAADVYVSPSLADNLPNTIMEAMACGTPTVAFAVGGIPELVRPGATGLLAAAGDLAAIRHATAALLRNETMRAEVSACCRRVAVNEYELTLQARRYMELYESLRSGAGFGNTMRAARMAT